MKLKSRMTVGEMSEHLTEHTGKFANRVSVGRYAKKLGYAVYKPMINGRICQSMSIRRLRMERGSGNITDERTRKRT